MTNEIDILMNLDPLELSDRNIEDIIAYHRKQRQNFELGVKPKKEKGPSVSLDSVVQALGKVAPAEPIKRRV